MTVGEGWALGRSVYSTSSLLYHQYKEFFLIQADIMTNVSSSLVLYI